MSMLDSFFYKGFKAAKCKTLLKLTIPRIKLLRNRREIQIKNMRRDIAKLLETGQEATARIRVEHIIREENMMAAQEILELFCELIAVRLPIIETQRECPLDLKEAISSVCFAAPRCADLSELLQVQMQFAIKYGKEFVSAATELRPDCGVNRQLIELLSVRAPSPETKLKLLKEIAEEHELDWDPAPTENEFLKPHEDLLNGPTQFVSGAKLPLPEEKHVETLYSFPSEAGDKQLDSDTGFDELDFPEVPKVVLRPNTTAATANSVSTPASAVAGSEIDHQSSIRTTVSNIPEKPESVPEVVVQDRLADSHDEAPQYPNAENAKTTQFLPFVFPPPEHSNSFAAAQSNSPLPPSTTKRENNVDLQDVLAAAQSAAETAERAAAAARSAATLAQVRIAELTQKKNEEVTTDSLADSPFSTGAPPVKPAVREEARFDRQDSLGDPNDTPDSVNIHQVQEGHQVSEYTDLPSFDKLHVGSESHISYDQTPEHSYLHHQPQRLPSMDDEPYFSYPNLFSSSGASLSPAGSFTDNSRTAH